MKETTAKETFSLDDLFLHKEKGVTFPQNIVSNLFLRDKKFLPVAYHPFQTGYIKTDNIPLNPENERHLQNFKAGGNIGIITEAHDSGGLSVFITNTIVNATFFNRHGVTIYPLYDQKKALTENHLNINKDLLLEFSRQLFLEFLPDSPPIGNVCYAESPEVRDDFKTHFTTRDLIHYLYAYLLKKHSHPKSKKSLLIPYPEEASFWPIVRTGKELRALHLREKSFSTAPSIHLSEEIEKGKIEKREYANQKIWINTQQYFYPVTAAVWNFSIGQYCPAKSFIEKEQGKALTADTTIQYKKILQEISVTLTILSKLESLI